MASVLVRLLPLRQGHAAVLRTFDIHRGPVYMPVRVTGVETVPWGDREVRAWRVEVTINSRTNTHRIDQQSRRRIRVRLRVDAATEMLSEHAPSPP